MAGGAAVAGAGMMAQILDAADGLRGKSINDDVFGNLKTAADEADRAVVAGILAARSIHQTRSLVGGWPGGAGL
jgi:hypothetical protein